MPWRCAATVHQRTREKERPFTVCLWRRSGPSAVAAVSPSLGGIDERRTFTPVA
jgi:hypothetical protein